MTSYFASMAGRSLYRAVGVLANSSHRQAFYPAYFNPKAGSYSTKASEFLKASLPKLWIAKMRTAFSWLDSDGDGYVTEKNFEAWIREMDRLFPDMSQQQKDILASKKSSVWNDLWGGADSSKGQITEDMYIERFYSLAAQEGGEEMIRREWEKNFTMMDANKDGMISKLEFKCFFDAWKDDPVGPIVAFRGIDENMDGLITCDEFVKAAIEFFLNFTDEAKNSKYLFGPLKF